MVISRDLKTQILINYYVGQATNSLNISQIARDAGGIDRKSVRNIVRNWEENHTTQHLTSSGAHLIVDDATLANFYNFAETLEGRKATLKELKKKCKLPYTIFRISQLLVRRGLRCRVLKKNLFLNLVKLKIG